MRKFIFILNLMTFSLYAQAPSDELSSKLQAIKTFKAQFTQVIKDANGQLISKNRGEMIIQRPGKFYWKSYQPDPTLVVADGKTLWNYDIDLAQVTKQPLQAALGKSPAALLAGNVSQIKKDFKISKEKNCPKPNQDCYLLNPVHKETNFSKIIIYFGKNAMTSIQMKDALGQSIRTDFNQVQINQTVPQSHFVFKVPHNVDVIDGGQ